MADYAPISEQLYAHLRTIRPSEDDGLEYFPCAVTLEDGERFERVYICEYEPYIRTWWVTPEEDPGKSSISIDRVTGIEESPFRLPPDLASQLYETGESGMGYTVFTIEFDDGSKQACLTGNAVDFPPLPPGKTTQNIVRVIPHEGRDQSPVNGPNYFWCLFCGIAQAS